MNGRYIFPLVEHFLRSFASNLLLENTSQLLYTSVNRSRRLFRQNLFHTGLEIDRSGVVCPRVAPGVNSVTEVDRQEDGNADIGSQKAAGGPVGRPEDVEAVDQGKDGESDHSDPGAPRLEPGIVVGQLGVADALGFERLAEAEIDDGTADPADESYDNALACELHRSN